MEEREGMGGVEDVEMEEDRAGGVEGIWGSRMEGLDAMEGMEEREEIRVSKLESSCSETEVSGVDGMGEIHRRWEALEDIRGFAMEELDEMDGFEGRE